MTALCREDIEVEEELGIRFADEPDFEECECLVDNHHGVYVPQTFAEQHGQAWDIDKDDLKVLLAGPDHLEYWDAWDNVLNNASQEHAGKTWFLHQDMDLFAVTYAG